MTVNLSKKSAQATTTKTVKQKGKLLSEETETKPVPMKELVPEAASLPAAAAPANAGPWCEVGVEASYTHNLGDYKSCKVGVTLKIPCKHDEIDEAFSYGETWVNEKMEKMMAEVTG